MSDEILENNEVRFTMRMEKGLYELLKKSAIENKRSIAKELEYITEFYLKKGFPIVLPNNVAEKMIEFLKYSPEIKKAIEEIEKRKTE